MIIIMIIIFFRLGVSVKSFSVQFSHLKNVQFPQQTTSAM